MARFARTGDADREPVPLPIGGLRLVPVSPTPARPTPSPDPSADEDAIDKFLIDRVCRGDASAFAALYDRYAARVHALVRAILRDEQLAEEATHDLFLVLWRQPHAYEPERGAFAAWLLRSARNRALTIRRRRREQPFAAAGEGHGPVDPASWAIDPDPDPADQAIGRVVGGQVRLALTQLSADHRRLLELAYFDGLSQREIAAHLNRPLGTVKTQIRSAMRRMAELLDGFSPVRRDVTGDGGR